MAVIKKLLPHQSAFLQAPHVFPDIRFVFMICGYGAGKTSSLIDGLCYWISRYQGRRDKEGRKPLFMLCASTLTFMKRTSVHDLLQALDNTNTTYKYHKDINQIEIGDVTVILQPVEVPSDIFGVNASCIFWDEADELPADIMLEAMRSLNERLRQQLIGARTPFMMITSTAQGKKGLYNCTLNFKQTGVPYMIIRGRTKDNIYLPKAYVDAMYAMYNEKERKCFLEGEFIAVDSNMVFPDYDPEINDLAVDLWDCVDENETIYIGADFNKGFNHAVAVAVIKGCIVLLKDYVFTDARRAPEVYRYDFPTQRIVWIPDMTYKEHFGEFRKELSLNRIIIAGRACNPVVTDRIFAINKCLHAQRMFVCPICTESKKSLATHQMDPKTGKPMKGGINAPDHHSDVIAYCVHYLLSWRKDLKDVYDLTLGRIYRYRDDPSLKGNRLLRADQIMGTAFTRNEAPAKDKEETNNKD